MNRKDFFKKLGIGALAVVIAPKILTDIKEQKSSIKSREYHLNHCKQIYQTHLAERKDRTYPNAQMEANLELQKRLMDSIWNVPFK